MDETNTTNAKLNLFFPNWVNESLVKYVIIPALGMMMIFAASWLFEKQLYIVFDMETYLVWHNILEFSSVIVAIIIFLLSWYAYSQLGNRREFFLGLAFLVVGVLDFMHALSFFGMPAFVSPNSVGKAINYWIISRLIQAIALAGSGFISTRPNFQPFIRPISMMIAWLFISATFYMVTYQPHLIPAMFVEGEGLTQTKIWLEYSVVIIILLAIGKYILIFRKTKSHTIQVLLLGLTFFIFSELSFTLYASAFDSYNLLGHIFKIGAMVSIFQALFVSSIQEPFTKRQQAEALLESERNLLRILIDNIPDYIFVKDQASKFILSNISHANAAGLTPNELIGMTALEAFPSEVATQFHLDDEQVLLTGEILINQERATVNEEGQSTWVLTTKVPLYDESKEIIGLVGISRDITERRQAEEKIIIAETNQRSLLESTDDFIVLSDAQGYPIFFNSSYAKVMKELLDIDMKAGIKPHELLPNAEMRQWWDNQHLRVLSGEKFTIEYTQSLSDEEKLHLEITYNPIEKDGKIIGFSEFSRDITERKQAEEKREQLLTELGHKNAELERFTYTVSHDLKSPIITIKGFLGYLEKNALEGNIEAMKKDIAFIANAADKMEQLLGELLELSRIGRLVNPPEQISIEVIVNTALDLVSNANEREFSLEIMPNLPTIYADRVRILQVFENLIGNAIKFCRYKSDARIEIGVREDNSEMVIYIQDNGIGIDPKYYENIFGLFNQLDPAIEGSGVGLAIVKRIIEAHDGRIWIESEGKEQGCTFCFTIPEKEADIIHS